MQNKVLALSLVAFVFSCSPNRYQAEPMAVVGEEEGLALKTAGLSRFILESQDNPALKAAVEAEKGLHVRNMESVQGQVVYLPAQAIQKLQSKFPDLKAYADIELKAVPDDLVEINARPGGGGAVQPAQSVPWGISRIQAPAAHAVSRGAGVKVCIVDTGIDKTHPDLVNNLAGGRNFVVSKGKIDPSRWSDDNGHGSHVAGIVAAEDNAIGAVGVAPHAKLYAVKVLDNRGSGYLSDVADGVTACVAAGAQVINMSLGSSGDPNASSPLKAAILNAQAAGAQVVVAAGNEGQDISGKIPAGYASVIAVAAIDSAGNYPSWSNFGLGADDVTAPGVGIYSTWKSGGYNTISGTSMASPHVAGVVALKLAAAGASLVAVDLGYPVSKQGRGMIDALGSVQP